MNIMTTHESPNFGRRASDIRGRICGLILHDTGPGRLEGVLSWLCDPKSQVSYHYVVSRSGSIYQLVPDEARAWHAGRAIWHGLPADVNGLSIGVALHSSGADEELFGYMEAQISACIKLVKSLVETYQIPVYDVCGHRDVAWPRGRKVDPCDLFPWARIVKEHT